VALADITVPGVEEGEVVILPVEQKPAVLLNPAVGQPPAPHRDRPRQLAVGRGVTGGRPDLHERFRRVVAGALRKADREIKAELAAIRPERRTREQQRAELTGRRAVTPRRP
jgi:hypothetical protein